MQTVAELSGLLRKGRLDPVELTESVLEAISTCDDQALFIDVLTERALKEARAARRRLKAGAPLSALDGVPIGWKDLFDIKGRVTTAGSVVLKTDPPAASDAALVSAAARAGMVSVGTLNMTEFAYSGIGLNPHYGTPRNPRDPKVHRSPGGSSSGSGAVVAKGILPVAIGTDTGGSIRIPASFNGVVGYKSSTGHYPMNGVFPLSRSLDTLGPLAQTVEDCALVDAVLSGTRKVRPRPAKGQAFIVPTNVMLDGLEDAVGANFERTLSRISKAGGKIRRIKLPTLDAMLDLIKARGHLLGAEALHAHWDRVFGEAAQRMDQRVVTRIRMSEKMTAVDLVDILLRRRELIAATDEQIGEAIVLCPTTPNVAMAVAPLEASTDEFFRANARTLRNTNLGNLLDWCGVSVPNGVDGDGMPTGFLMSGRHGGDARVLGLGLALEPVIRG